MDDQTNPSQKGPYLAGRNDNPAFGENSQHVSGLDMSNRLASGGGITSVPIDGDDMLNFPEPVISIIHHV